MVEVPDNKEFELTTIRDYSSITGFKIVKAGHDIFWGLEYLFPDLGINGLLNKACMIGKVNLKSAQVLEQLKLLEQYPVPNVPYVLVDHHPGTWREIPSEALTGLKENFKVIENPRDIPLFSLVSLIECAQEIHFVTSAPLCLALMIRQNAEHCFAYCAPPLLKNDYSGWVEKTLPNSEGFMVLKEPRKSMGSRRIDLSKYFDRLCL